MTQGMIESWVTFLQCAGIGVLIALLAWGIEILERKFRDEKRRSKRSSSDNKDRSKQNGKRSDRRGY